MKFYLTVLKIAVVLIVFSPKVFSGKQPAYQVSLYMHLHPREPHVHFCNGVIVQSRLILTTASCVYYKFSSNNNLGVPIEPKTISVISGSSTAFNEELMLKVSHVFVADHFNYTTGANDLALLRLNGILPLDTRNDTSWVTLADDEKYDSPCMVNFPERNSAKDTPNYIQSEQLPILDSEICRVASGGFINRDNDICSLYYLPTAFNCDRIEISKNYNDDQGTGLVCGNKLIGLLSTILPWQNITDCSDRPIKAYFTAVVPRLTWIFNIITDEDKKMLNDGVYISSSPYAGETNAFINPQTTAFTPAYNTTLITSQSQSTELLAQQNNAASSETYCNFWCKILGTFYLILTALSC